MFFCFSFAVRVGALGVRRVTLFSGEGRCLGKGLASNVIKIKMTWESS